MSSTREGTVNAILDKLFVNGMGQRADRMVLVQEDYSGRATVSDARDLGGWGRLPVRDLLLAALQQREQEVRADERERAAKALCGFCEQGKPLCFISEADAYKHKLRTTCDLYGSVVTLSRKGSNRSEQRISRANLPDIFQQYRRRVVKERYRR